MIKYIAMKIDSMSGGRVRKTHRWLRGRIDQPGNREIKAAVRSALGGQGYKAVQNMRLAFLPNEVRQADWSAGGYVIEKILMALSITPRPFNPWCEFDVFLNWQDLTFSEIDASGYLRRSYDYTGVQKLERAVLVNFRCADISKKRIAEANLKALGYPLDVDPTEYSGSVVCKSDENAAHDGVVINCPISPTAVLTGKVYNVEVQNLDGDDVIDFRVPYVRGDIGFFYEKRRPIASRFSNTNSTVTLRKIADEFSVAEVSAISNFCIEIGADYGELDVLRDKRTGRIYIVDFAKTPAGPPNGLSGKDAKVAIQNMAVAFARNILLAQK